MHCSIHPTIVSNILDHFLRRPQGENTVVGTLLGGVDGQLVDIQTCFSVPFEKEEKEGFVLDKDYLHKMLKFHRKVNPKEDLVGLYVSGDKIDATILALFNYYQQLSKEKKNKSPLQGQPLMLMIDPTMKNNKLSIKVCSSLSKNCYCLGA